MLILYHNLTTNISLVIQILEKKMAYRTNPHSVYQMSYHIILVTKYRRKVINQEMTEVMRERAAELLDRVNGSLIEFNSDQDHVHLLIELTPSVAPSAVVNNLKSQLSRLVRKQFADHIKKYLWGDAFWSSSYFICTTGGVTLENLKAYVESQQTEEHQRKYKKQDTH